MTRPELESLAARINAGEYNTEMRAMMERALGMLLRNCSEFTEQYAELRAKLDAVTSERDVLAQQVDELSAPDDGDDTDADAASNEEDVQTSSKKKRR